MARPKGIKVSEETKIKMRISANNSINIGRFKKGMTPWNKGKKGLYKATQDTKIKMSISCKKKGIGKWFLGRKMSEKQRRNIGKANSGSNCHFWKGGISRDDKKRYHDIEYKLWREKVFKRDNYTCQDCNKTGIYITAHHIKSWRNYPELRFNIDNGRTLCEKCHSLTDNYKGRVIKKERIKLCVQK